MKIAIFSLFVFLLSCTVKKSTKCVMTLADIIKFDSTKEFITDNPLEKVTKIEDNADNKARGEYSFYGDGRLKSYKFFANSNAYTYNEEYDLLGNISKQDGKPLVNIKIKQKGSDTFDFKFYFFSLNRHYEELYISTQAWTNHVSLRVDTSYAFMMVGRFKIINKGDPFIGLRYSIRYENTCTAKNETLADSISLKRGVTGLYEFD